eukprot:scaffold18.g1886.t1
MAAARPRSRSLVARSSAIGAQENKASTNGIGKAGAALDFDELTELIKMVHSTDIVELELNSKKFKLSVKKKEALEAAEPQIVHVAAAPAPTAYGAAPLPAAPAPAPPAPAAAPAAAAAAAAAAPAPPPAAAVEGFEVVAPMAGTFYRSPAPGEPAFVKEGDSVTKGQNICIIEAEVSGTIAKIVAKNGKPVVPGQILIIIRP